MKEKKGPEVKPEQHLRAAAASGESGKQDAEPSKKRPVCEICCERKQKTVMFINEACRSSHSSSVCTDCIRKHIQVKIESNSSLILCPALDCTVALSPASCKEFLPKRVLERWESTIIEAAIPDSEKFYCPFKDCSAMLVNDYGGGGGDETRRTTTITESECPHCRRLICVQCHVPWHSGMDCGGFRSQRADKRGRGEAQLKKLAKKMKWKRCPNCIIYVEQTHGCVHMTCRCRFEFCYNCGRKWSTNHEEVCEVGTVIRSGIVGRIVRLFRFRRRNY